MKNIIFLLSFAMLAFIGSTNLQAQNIAVWPMGAASVPTLTTADTTYTMRNTLSYLSYGSLSADQKVDIEKGAGLKQGSSIYLVGAATASGVQFILSESSITPAAYDTIAIDSGKTTIIHLMYTGTSLKYLNKFEY